MGVLDGVGAAVRRIVIVVMLALAGCGESTPPLTPLAPDARIVAFGDSLTRGTGAPTGSAYPEVLERRIDREVINAGKPGEVSEAGRQRLPEVLERHEPDLVLLCHGGNDFLQNRDPKGVRRNLRAMIEAARANGAEVVLIGVPSRGITLSTAPLYGELASQMGVPIVRDAVSTILREPDLRADRVHPNAKGYRRLAEAVREVLMRSGALTHP